MLTQHRVNGGMGRRVDGVILGFTYLAMGMALVQWMYP